MTENLGLKKQVLESNSFPVADISWAVPGELGIPVDPLRLRVDFHLSATTITYFEEGKTETKVVDALDITHALASSLTFSTGMLPPGCLWWANTKKGPVYAVYTEPQTRKLALQLDINKPARRYTVPMPGLIFLCRSGSPPWVFAVGKKPTKESNVVYKAPLANVYENGRTCGGSHKYPERIADIVQSFFMSFFSATADLKNRSKKHPDNIIKMWEELNGSTAPYPIADLIKFGTVGNLMEIG